MLECVKKPAHITFPTAAKENKMSRSAEVMGYQDITTRHYFIVELDDVNNEDDARDQTHDKIENDGVKQYEDWSEEQDRDDVEITDVEISNALYTVSITIEGVEAENEEEIDSVVGDLNLSNCIYTILNVVEEKN
jgi:hypothetical protein